MESEITTETLGNKEFNINLSYYFNRATKSLELEALSHIKEVSIYDMNGRLINLETPDTLKSNIDFNDIPKGFLKSKPWSAKIKQHTYLQLAINKLWTNNLYVFSGKLKELLHIQ